MYFFRLACLSTLYLSLCLSPEAWFPYLTCWPLTRGKLPTGHFRCAQSTLLFVILLPFLLLCLSPLFFRPFLSTLSCFFFFAATIFVFLCCIHFLIPFLTAENIFWLFSTHLNRLKALIKLQYEVGVCLRNIVLYYTTECLGMSWVENWKIVFIVQPASHKHAQNTRMVTQNSSLK